MTGRTFVRLCNGPLPASAPWAPAADCGAVLTFEGVVRSLEEGRALAALLYERYEPMTSRELERLADATAEEHGLSMIGVEHSVGRVAVGEVSFRLTIASKHRAEAIAATDAFIAQMKRAVPLWKVPEFEQ